MAAHQVNALVTGGAKRIGRAIVEDLAAAGFGVAIHANGGIDEAGALADSIRASGGHAAAFQADLLDPHAAAGLVDRAAEGLGDLSIVVHCASIFESDDIGALDWELWDRHQAIHVKAPVAMAERLAARLGGSARGLVVSLIDQRVWKPTPTHFSYAVSKAALWWVTRTMAQALAPSIRVNAIGPGPTLANTRQAPEDFQRQVDAIPLREAPPLAEFGATVRYLWQATSVTGQMIALDGGQHLAWLTPDVAGIRE